MQANGNGANAHGSKRESRQRSSKKRPAQTVEVSLHTDPRIDTLLERYSFAYILSQVKRMVRLPASIACPDAREMELRDIAQEVYIHFWQKLQKGPIQHPDAYLAQMIRNECLDVVRRETNHPNPQSLPLTEHGELLDNCLMLMATPGEGMADPAEEFEQQSLAAACIARIAAAIMVLPAREKQAIACSLFERVHDLAQLRQAFMTYGMGDAHWPTDKADEHRLKAILRSARLAMAKQLRVNLALYKMGQGRPAPPLKPCC